MSQDEREAEKLGYILATILRRSLRGPTKPADDLTAKGRAMQ